MKYQQNNFAFIDGQNLHLATLDAGWKLDYQKFRKYLHDKYSVQRAYLFLGYIPKYKDLYASLESKGYTIIFKPTLKSKIGIIKGNCDAELVLHCMIEYENFAKAIIITGDGDFYCLINYLLKKDKLLKLGIPNSQRYSALLGMFKDKIFFINFLKRKFSYKKEAS